MTDNPAAPNTTIGYWYADGDNYKQAETIIVAGTLAFADLEPFLDEGEFFIPSQVGLADLQERFTQPGDDHPWHRLAADSLQPTAATPTVRWTAGELVEWFRQAHAQRWKQAGTIIACLRDGLEVTGYDFPFTFTGPRHTVRECLRQAITEYLRTDAGRAIAEQNGGNFNWGDAVLHVPEAIWTRHGIFSLQGKDPRVLTLQVDHDENFSAGLTPSPDA